MARLWLKNEVFDGVLPIKSSGVALSPGPHSSPGKDGIGGTAVFSLVTALREANPTTVCYTTWIAEGWRILQWSEPAAKLFWEMLAMYHRHTPSR
ncbi:unnamed protein product [Choristocarpus tenellus]